MKLATRILFVLAATFAMHRGEAQVTTAKINGTITDPSGSAVPKATVKLESVTMGVVRSTETDEQGRFSFSYVAVGSYRLAASHAGFREAVRPDLNPASGDELDLNVQLEVEGVGQTVSVTDEPVALNTTNAEQRSTYGNRELNQLPVQHLDWTNLLPLSAGTTKPPGSGTTSGTSSAGSGLNINGLPSAGYNLTVDGTNATSNPEFTAFNFYQGPNIINTINNEAIQEVTLARGVPPATVGNTISGNINLVTKSGSNEYHGSLYEINELSAYDARNQFLTRRPRSTFNQYGGSFGAPILKNKLFFFTSYAGGRLSAFTPVTGTVPSPYLRSIAPAVYQPLLALMPNAPQPANATATTAQYFGSDSIALKDGNLVGRMDYYFNSTNMLAVRYIRARPSRVLPNLLPVNSQVAIGHTDALNTSYTHSSAQWTENTRFGFNQLKYTRIDSGYAIQLPALIFGFSTAGANQFLQHGNYTTIEQGVSYVRGPHNIQFGGIYQRRNGSRYKLGTPAIAYSTLQQFLNNTPAAVSLSLYQLSSQIPPFGYVDHQFGGYVQDDWKMRRNLTLSIGVRYDLYTVPKEYQGRVYNPGVDPQRPGLGPGFGPFRPADSIYDADHKNFQPRVGLAYNPFPNTVLRAGFGILKEGHNLFSGPVGLFRVTPSLPFGVNLNQIQTAAAGLQYPINAIAYAQEVPQLQSQGILASTFASPVAMNTFNPNPYSIQWMFGVQQVLPRGVNLDVTYSANRGLREFFNETVNLPDRITGIAPAPNYGSFGYFTPVDRSKYASLQVAADKRFSNGFSASIMYVWSKVNSFGDADVLQQTPPQDINNIRADWGPAPFDVRNRFLGTAIWTLPLNRWTRTDGRAAKMILGGWEMSGIFSAQNGLPANIGDGASSYPASRPDATGADPYLSGYQTGLHQYLDPNAFKRIPISPTSGAQIRPGNLGRNAIVTPGFWNLDASLAKNLNVTERFKLRLSAQTFNTLNHTNLGGLVTLINASSFGRLTTATPRTMQIGARLTF